jgi:hypothetical protein
MFTAYPQLIVIGKTTRQEDAFPAACVKNGNNCFVSAKNLALWLNCAQNGYDVALYQRAKALSSKFKCSSRIMMHP